MSQVMQLYLLLFFSAYYLNFYMIIMDNFYFMDLIIFFIISFAMGILIFYCIEFIISCLVFLVSKFSVGGWLSSEMTKYSRRPDSIYKGKFRRIVFTVFPMAMITSVPARTLIFGPDIYLLGSQFFSYNRVPMFNKG